jgi:glycosyltransferase involved in cell wall biosynthesis
MSLKLSVGVAALNEDPGIVDALQSILRQTVFRDARSLGLEAELIVMASGYADHTVAVTESFFEEMRAEFPRISGVSLRLEELSEAGFASAVNLLTHTFSRPDADFIFFVDAGIVIEQPEAFERMLDELQKNEAMQLISPVGRRQIEASKCRSLCDRLSLAAPRKTRTVRMFGHCFCARADALRSVWIPKRLPCAAESVFKRMIVSDMASGTDHPERIGLADNAGCTFESYCTFAGICRRHVRLFTGQAFLKTLTGHLQTMKAEQREVDLAAYLRARDATDPSWLHRLVQLNIRDKGLFATLPSPWLRFGFWKNPDIGTVKKLGMLPGAAAALFLDIPAFLFAAWCLKTGKISTGWSESCGREPDSAGAA